MFRRGESRRGGSPSQSSLESFTSITSGLAELYNVYLLPLEKDFRFSQFHSPIMTAGDFKAKPMVLLLGQYSTGKTTFVRHLLEKDYPGLRIGPEPTTDKFVAVCHIDKMVSASDANVMSQTPGTPSKPSQNGSSLPPQVLPGRAAVVDRDMPWSQLENFGPGFLSRFEVVHVVSPVFKGVTLIDTPGVLAGNKQWERGYDFEGVIKWFADRVDLVLLFFDAHKLDISDEFRRCINALRGNDSKVCILLNKADSVSSQQLMRVYGALMWSLGKVLPIPEVPRIHIGSFWDQPLKNEESRHLFEAESEDLFRLIFSLPSRSAARKIDDFLKRIRLCRVHCLLVDHLRKQLPLIGKGGKQKELLSNLPEIYQQMSTQMNIPLSDFPDPEEFKKSLNSVVLSKLPKLDLKKIKMLDQMIQTQIASLTRLIPIEEVSAEHDLIESVIHTNPHILEASPHIVLPSTEGNPTPVSRSRSLGGATRWFRSMFSTQDSLPATRTSTATDCIGESVFDDVSTHASLGHASLGPQVTRRASGTYKSASLPINGD